MELFDAAIIGGGPAGSASALYLRQLGLDICVIEKSRFPRETVCGEFLSNEVTASLKELDLLRDFMRSSPNPIHSIHLHSEYGRTAEAELGFPAFGMKRGAFDHLLLAHAKARGACVIQPADVTEVIRSDGKYVLRCSTETGPREVFARIVVGAYGRQNILDRRLHRHFTDARSRLNGIKIHIGASHCPGLDPRGIHLFTGSHLYCGVNAVNDGDVTVCFLERRASGDEPPHRQLTRLAAENAAFRNCFDGTLARECETGPRYGTGNIYFGRKESVVDGILMVGDAAEVIAPLAGDGIGMAFQGARCLAEIVSEQRTRSLDARAAALLYRRRREELFRRRIRVAGYFQTVLLSPPMRRIGLPFVRTIPGLLTHFVALTRG